METLINIAKTSTIVSIGQPDAYKSINKENVIDSNYRWVTPPCADNTITAELNFNGSALIELVSLIEFSGEDWPKRIEKIKIELASSGNPYYEVFEGVSALYEDSKNFTEYIFEKQLSSPKKANRMRITIFLNALGMQNGINVKSINAFGVPNENKQNLYSDFCKTLDIAYSKKSTDFSISSFKIFSDVLNKSKNVLDNKNSSISEVNKMNQMLIDAIYNLEPKEIKTDNIRMAFVGDSITYGSTLEESTLQDERFSTLIFNKLNSLFYEVRNFGVSGAALTFAADYAFNAMNEYQNSLVYDPHIVVIMLGTNDSKPINFNNNMIDKYKSDARILINSYKLLITQPIIVFCTSPFAITPNKLDSNADLYDTTIIYENIKKIAKLQREVAKENNVYLIDVNKKSSNFSNDMYTDGIHPNAKGHKELANIIYTGLLSIKENICLNQRLLLKQTSYIDNSLMSPNAYSEFIRARKKLQSELNNDISTINEILLARENYLNIYNNLNSSLDTNVIRVSCVGDSLTFGGYPALLNQKITDDKNLQNKYVCTNYGVNGAALKPTDRGYIRTESFPKSKCSFPNIVIIMLGTNDSGQIVENDKIMINSMNKLVAEYKSLPTNPKIILCTSPTAFPQGSITESVANNINNIIVPLQKEMAISLNLKIIDINKATQNFAYLAPDGCHFKDYDIFATTIYNFLTTNNIIF